MSDIHLFNPYHDRLGRFAGSARSGFQRIRESESVKRRERAVQRGSSLVSTTSRFTGSVGSVAWKGSKFATNVITLPIRGVAWAAGLGLKASFRSLMAVQRLMTYPFRKEIERTSNIVSGVAEKVRSLAEHGDESTEGGLDALAAVLSAFLEQDEARVLALPEEDNPDLSMLRFERMDGYWVADREVVEDVLQAVRKYEGRV